MKKLIYIAIAIGFLSSCGTQQKIAYNVLEDAKTQNYEIYVMETDGTNAKNISNSTSVDWVYDSFDDKLYFLSDRNACFRCFYLYEMDAEGNKLRKVTDFKLADSWLGSRKKGTEFIVKPAEATDTTFYIIDLQGTILEKIAIELPFASDPAFSPDGKQIVFRGSTKTSPRDIGFTDALYVLNLETKVMTKITSHPDEAVQKRWTGYLAAAPRWRTDGKISFASKRDNNYDIYTINPDGTDMTSVTPKANNQVYHSWNSDGTLIFEASMNNQNGYDLYMISNDGTLTQLTNDETEQYAPVFVRFRK